MPESHKVKAIKILHKKTEDKTYRGKYSWIIVQSQKPLQT